MPEELFYEEFNGKLDTTKWEEVGGLRGVRSKSRFGSGRIELANSVATLYGGGNRHDYAIKTVKTFSPSDGELSAEVNMLIQRPNPKMTTYFLDLKSATYKNMFLMLLSVQGNRQA